MLVLLTTLSLAYVNVVLGTLPADETSQRSRTADFYATANSNETGMVCTLNISNGQTNIAVSNNTEFYLIPTSPLADLEYKWNINCTAGSYGNVSAYRNITIGSTYESTDLASVAIDNIVGIGAALFALVALIGLIFFYKWVKKTV